MTLLEIVKASMHPMGLDAVVTALKKARFSDIRKDDSSFVHFTRFKKNTVDKFTVQLVTGGELKLTVQGWKSDLPVGTFISMDEVIDALSSVNQKWFDENDVETA